MNETVPHTPVLSRQESRIHRRDAVQIKCRLTFSDEDSTGMCANVSIGGIRILSHASLDQGTPLAVQCRMAADLKVSLSGQVVYCQRAEPLHYAIGIRFVSLPKWQQRIFKTMVDELKQNAAARDHSSVVVKVVTDSLAPEASRSSRSETAWPAVTGTAASPSPDSLEPLRPRKIINRLRRFTPNPEWVLAMDHDLEPYRKQIWNSKLVVQTATGELSLKQVRGWSIQFYPFIESFPQFIATYLAKAPDPASRAFLIDNLKVEKRHAEQWIDMAKGFGVSRDELFSTPVIPEVEALTHWLWSITNRGSFIEAVAAANYAIEGVTQGIATAVIKGFIKYHGKEGVFLDKKAYYWMENHAAYDDLHPYEALEIIKTHAMTQELQERIKHAAQRSLEFLHLALESCYIAHSDTEEGGSCHSGKKAP
jgi:pyrroloquinoline quinone (PQQ) biosynthesis protein C